MVFSVRKDCSLVAGAGSKQQGGMAPMLWSSTTRVGSRFVQIPCFQIREVP
jgi:hypothetical protein